MSHSLTADAQGLHGGTPPEPCVVVIFGASGDLAGRELIPALFELERYGLLPEQFAVVGFSNADWDDDGFRDEMREKVKRHCAFDEALWRSFGPRLYYLQGDFRSPPDQDYARLSRKLVDVRTENRIGHNALFHLATPPSFFGVITARLAGAELARSDDGWRRIVIEKPFGVDERSSRELNAEIARVFDEDQVYRIDHFLGKETVQNMLVFRFANPSFEPIWNRNYIDHVQVTVAEDIGIGTRARFYEATGVVRDMLQNHLLQLVSMTAIEPPGRFEGTSLRNETAKVLEAICAVDVDADCVSGQYGAGRIGGSRVPAYRSEDGVADGSITPTYAAVRLTIDNWRWAGVPFYLRTGKRLASRLTEVAIQFKPTPHLMFPVDHSSLASNTLVFRLQPREGIVQRFLAKQPGPGLEMRSVDMSFGYATTFGMTELPPAYAWLLLDAMQGDQTLFARADWIDRAWQIVDPIVSRWEEDAGGDPSFYPAGSEGPEAAAALLARDGRTWRTIAQAEE
ncbi:MAG: glucose-6-phosphate dehydrogenase [Candidatus Palauibacterales bacterium]|nr:glucose-6-phosphate dehydrogenase [Candidatus Palauibacterales bacterium]MDP2483548.1 glucose-6-phosphate dehydrogenase [Candidatus Palauibacterales bacterium]